MIKKPKNSNEDISQEQNNEGLAEESNEKEAEVAEQNIGSEEECDVSEKEDVSDELENARKEIAELKDTHLRLRAEYENFKKRTVKEKEAIHNDSVRDTVSELLPVIDNFERALASFSEEDKKGDFYKGMEMIYNQTVETFTKLGVAPIEAVGCEFDPELHNAVMHIEDETIADNTVVEEFQKGYTYRDKVIRYSMVKVAN